ncbi:SGNH/GDSL hydrolase family protein [Aeoliella mucimassa]|uniref:GDSL-like Lipase/Acylhydrolase n=1 Tax=Aeoliella mucimassa TaxID=2527972 RepID=A0A518APX1_9BACT|nr:SGNH/GDSL hydrolase family protein [Aeoliella mucimassa]QDU56767.1 GDSL-like Lipase/Acylhydrolase [Aeoliella mucimassa]
MRLFRLLLVVVCIGLWNSAGAEQPVELKSGDHIAICGDSITEQKIYSAYMETYFLACQPAAKLQSSQFGWGGETSWGFAERMENDVIPFESTVATMCYGMNDGGYSASNPEQIEKYRAALTEVVQTFKQAGVRQIVVGSPGPVDSDSFKGVWFHPITADEYNHTLADLTAAAQTVAEAEGVQFANLHAEGMRVMQAMKQKYGKEYYLFGDDGIHPREAGHLLMAHAMLKALGCDGNIGTITIDLEAAEATATDGHQVLNVQDGTVSLKSTRYPFCFTGDPAKPEATTGVIEFLPFNQELNRLTLVVSNIPADAKQVQVQWGKETKEFTREQLASGINLAAEFLNNPFSEPFHQVHEAVLRQQRYETPMMKDMLHSIPDWKRQGVDTDFDALVKELVSVDKALRKSAGESVVPVEHSIRITY